jgi:hypothetical protein
VGGIVVVAKHFKHAALKREGRMSAKRHWFISK